MSHSHTEEDKYILEYAKICTVYCSLLENAQTFEKPDFIIKVREILALLYYKTISLPVHECGFDGHAPQHVTEHDYEALANILSRKIGGNDEYLEVFDARISDSEGPFVRKISEDLADIYQDVKNFSLNYGVGAADVVHDSIHECINNFNDYWGQNAVNVLRALHSICSGQEELIDDEQVVTNQTKTDKTENWLINQFFNDGEK